MLFVSFDPSAAKKVKRAKKVKLASRVNSPKGLKKVFVVKQSAMFRYIRLWTWPGSLCCVLGKTVSSHSTSLLLRVEVGFLRTVRRTMC